MKGDSSLTHHLDTSRPLRIPRPPINQFGEFQFQNYLEGIGPGAPPCEQNAQANGF